MKKRDNDSGDNWATPRYVLDILDKEFNFSDFDPCPLNNDITQFDGLRCDWEGETIFVNCPYSRPLKEAFIHKAVEQMKWGKTVVMLLPVSTSTKIFHEVIMPNADEIRLVKKRIRFEGMNTKGEFVTKSLGQHDSMIIVFRPNRRHPSISDTPVIFRSQTFEQT